MLEQVARRYSEVERHLCDVRESCFRLRTARPTSRPKISDQTRNELRAAKIPAGKVLRSLREFTEDLFSLLGRWRYGANDFYENPAVRDLESA